MLKSLPDVLILVYGLKKDDRDNEKCYKSEEYIYISIYLTEVIY